MQDRGHRLGCQKQQLFACSIGGTGAGAGAGGGARAGAVAEGVTWLSLGLWTQRGFVAICRQHFNNKTCCKSCMQREVDIALSAWAATATAAAAVAQQQHGTIWATWLTKCCCCRLGCPFRGSTCKLAGGWQVQMAFWLAVGNCQLATSCYPLPTPPPYIWYAVLAIDCSRANNEAN